MIAGSTDVSKLHASHVTDSTDSEKVHMASTQRKCLNPPISEIKSDNSAPTAPHAEKGRANVISIAALSGMQSFLEEIDSPELNDAVASLSIKERTRFWDMVDKKGPRTAILGNAAMRDAFSNLPQDTQEKICHRISKCVVLAYSTDHIQQAFRIIYDVMTRITDSYIAQHGMTEDVPRRIQEFKDLVYKAFSLHDIDNSNTLDAMEARAFFSTFVVDYVDIINSQIATQVNANLEARLASIPKHDEEKRKIFTAVFAEMRDEEMNRLAQQAEAYKTNKSERDVQAFNVCDTDGDGTLRWEEFIAAVLPGGERNRAFITALGLSIPGGAV